MRLKWSSGAKRDLLSVGDFIAANSPEAARRFTQKLVDRSKQASRFPDSGRIVPEFGERDLRELIVGNYRIVYEVNRRGRSVTVLTVFEGHKLVPRDLNSD